MKAFFKHLLWIVLWLALFLGMGFLGGVKTPEFLYTQF